MYVGGCLPFVVYPMVVVFAEMRLWTVDELFRGAFVYLLVFVFTLFVFFAGVRWWY